MDNATVPVLVGACLCPGAPHEDGDFVYLRSRLSLSAGVRLQTLIVEANQAGDDTPTLTGKLAEAYLQVGVVAWNLVDTDDNAIPVTIETITEHLVNDFTRSSELADKADDLYRDAVIGPLVRRAAALSSSTTTNGSTSRTPTGQRKGPKRSKPSSTSTTPTAATATTL